ncbi:MAG: methionyl-tRNA formyltransferase [Alphaproteobacteria bacterium]|nr:methionyl-tRNA formyltransferase [Alphaproteobacteria bacterium]MBF0128458.1 methionyl-tRNA formyltransferase [Alphaproteobacteria bacterium]
MAETNGTRIKVVFMGTPDFAAVSLRALCERHEVICVYSQPPRPAGRGHRERPGPVHELALARGIPVRTPVSLKSPDEQAAFAALGADVAVVAAYGLILPRPILDAPRLGCVNVHASLLPRWRGAAPIHRAVMAGDTESGITIMRMDAGLDTGPILLAERIPITDRTTAGTLHDQLAPLGARLVLEALDGLVAGTLPDLPQPDGATYAAKLDRNEGRLDWTRPAAELERMVRGLSPWPGSWFEHRGTRIRVLDALPMDQGGEPGRVLDDHLSIACGTGALRLTRVQRPGKSAMDADVFLRGYPLSKGTML